MPKPPDLDICPLCNHGQHEGCNGMTWRAAGWEVLRVPCGCKTCRPEPAQTPVAVPA